MRTSNAAEETPGRLVEGMLGRSMDLAFPPKDPPASDAPTVLEVEGLAHEGGEGLVSLEIRAGEIVGLAGLVGSGRSEVARAVLESVPTKADEYPWQGANSGVTTRKRRFVLAWLWCPKAGRIRVFTWGSRCEST